MNKKNFTVIIYVLVILAGTYLLVGATMLNIILRIDLPSALFWDYIGKFESIFYSIIPYKINIFIMFCVPFIDLFIILKMSKSNKGMKMYLWSMLLIYTGFFVLRLSTLQA